MAARLERVLGRWFPFAVNGLRINATWLIWVSVAAEIGTGIVFAIVGIRAHRHPSGVGSVVQLQSRQGVSR
jgi:hypothetical protein